jgi:SAM-dependent methyltransferase
MSACGHAALTPSAWVQRWSHLVPAGGTVLDVACGQGRHLRWFAQRGHAVTGIDRDAAALAAAGTGRLIEADIENGPWPLRHTDGQPQTFDAVIVTHYLWRALFPVLLASVAPGGVLIYETFAAGNETVGKPSRLDFLLQPGELLRLCAPLRVVAYEDGYLDAPPRFVQRIAAVREDGLAPAGPRRYPL